MKIGCIIQCRATSTRLPNKIMKNLPYNSDKTVLGQVIARARKSKFIDDVIIATTTDSSDDEIALFASNNNINYYRGSMDNVLSRYYEAAVENNLDIVVRITSDCPCIDYLTIDKIISSHLENNNDYTSNVIVRTYPHGLDTEVLNMDTLAKAYKNATEKYELEHVTPYINKTNKEQFKIEHITIDKDYSNIRITLDTKEDYTLLCCVYDYLYANNELFVLEDIINLFESKPWLYSINSNIIQKKVCKNLQEEIEESVQILNKNDLHLAVKYMMEKNNES